MKTLNIPCWWCGKRLMESHATVEIHGVERKVHKCCVLNATNQHKYFEVHTDVDREDETSTVCVQGGYQKLPYPQAE